MRRQEVSCRLIASCRIVSHYLPNVQQRNLRDAPARIGAGDLELDHRDCIRWTAHDAQTTTNTLLFVDNHVSTPTPVLSANMHGIAFDHAGETLHADAVVGTNVYTARTENTDRWINHNIQLALQTTPRLLHRLFRRVACLRLTGVAEALFQRQRRHELEGDRFIVIHHAAPIIGQLYLFCRFSRHISTAEIAVNSDSSITTVTNG